jgi:peptide/nickel transport system ATP-binding protein/peptide/nickel transport system permease protein
MTIVDGAAVAHEADRLSETGLIPRGSSGPTRLLLRRFRHHRTGMVGLAILLFIIAIAIFAPLIAPHDPNAQSALINEGPSSENWLGTDDLGRDLLSRVIYGARSSLVIATGIVALAVALALPLALLAGYRGGWVDSVISRFTDAMFAFPPLVLALAIVSLRGRSTINLIVAIGLVFVPSLVRLIRGQVLAVREETYIEAARSVGTRGGRIAVRHVLPNVASPLIIQVAITLGFALLAEAGLGFLGLGPPPPTADWGEMLKRSFDFVLVVPWQIFVAGGAITLTVLAFNLIGDGLRDALGRTGPVPAPGEPRTAPVPGGDTDGLLEVRGLSVEFTQAGSWVRVVDDVDLTLAAGRTLALVGESGCGKTVTALAIMGLLPRRTGRVATGSMRVNGRELVDLAPGALRAVRGRELAMIFQEPDTSLNPAFTVGDQIAEVARIHRGLGRRAAQLAAIEALERVDIPVPAQRAKAYPHELSGGMRQRAMIAMALVGEPRVLLADEPTTALDVTIQAQILELLASLRDELGMAMVFVTHDLGVVAEIADDVAVMYAGQIVEQASVEELFARPRHPYTEALIRALPQSTVPGERLATIPGQVPDPQEWPTGCRFADRCPYAEERCRADAVELRPIGGAMARCVRVDELALVGAPS